MNAQQQMMQLLQATNAYYQAPTEKGWEPSQTTDLIFARHKITRRDFFFSFNPETKVIKAESFSLKKPGSITVYTSTIALGGRLIAPDMILALHTLFSFDFASDAVYVVEKNIAKLQRPTKEKKKFSIASDDSLAGKNTQASNNGNAQVRNAAHSQSVSSRSKTSRFLRFFVYGESPFHR